MKRLFTMLFAAAAVVGCAGNDDKVVLSDQNTENQAYEISALAYKVVEAKSYEEFKAAREELEKYGRPSALRLVVMHTLSTLRSVTIFLRNCNRILL